MTSAEGLERLITTQWERPEDVLENPHYRELLDAVRLAKEQKPTPSRHLRLLFIEEKLERCLSKAKST